MPNGTGPLEQKNNMCTEQGSASKFVDGLLCIEFVVQMWEQLLVPAGAGAEAKRGVATNHTKSGSNVAQDGAVTTKCGQLTAVVSTRVGRRRVSNDTKEELQKLGSSAKR